jgi:autotransporter passenger strand-loop-strand repeat protein
MTTTVVSSGVVSSGLVVAGGNIVEVQSGGTANSTTVSNGGLLFIDAGGSASSSVIASGGVDNVSGSDRGDTINNGGTEVVFAGGSVNSAIINSGGFLYIDSGGACSGITVNSGGTLVISAGDAGFNFNNNGTVVFQGSPVTSNHTFGVQGGGGGTGTIVVSAATLRLSFSGSNNTSGGPFVVSGGGRLELTSAGAAVGRPIDLADINTIVQIDGSTMPIDVISGFIRGERWIDLTALSISSMSGAQVMSGNVLQVNNGGTLYELQLDTTQNYAGQSLEVLGDGGSGTLIGVGQPVTVLPGSSISNTTVSSGQPLHLCGRSRHLGDNRRQRYQQCVRVRVGGQGFGHHGRQRRQGVHLRGGDRDRSYDQQRRGHLDVRGHGFRHHGECRRLARGLLRRRDDRHGMPERQLGWRRVRAWQRYRHHARQRRPTDRPIRRRCQWNHRERRRAAEFVFSGGLASGSTVNSGGFELVGATGSAGGTAIGTVVNSSGTEKVCSGGLASFTVLNSGGGEFVSSGGTDSGATVNGNAFMEVLAGGKSISSLLTGSAPDSGGNFGGQEFVSSGGSALDTTVSASAVLIVSAGGVAVGTTVYSRTDNQNGGLLVFGNTTGTIINSGGGEFVSSGGTESGATVNAGGALVVDSSGTASSTVVNGSGAAEFVNSGGVTSGTTVNGGGFEQVGGAVSPGGTAIGTVINSGGTEDVFSGGLASGAVVGSGGQLIVSSGGTASGATLSGGVEYVSSGGVARDVTFAGPVGTLKLLNPAGLTGTISNWQIGDVIDFVNTSVTSASISGSTLNITISGGQSFSYALSSPQTSDADLRSDGAGGTEVFLEVEQPPTLSVSISGTAAEGSTLTAVPVANDSDAQIKYQWEALIGSTWTKIKGATQATYVVTEANEGDKLRVKATSTDTDGSGTKATSAATKPVTDTPPVLTIKHHALTVAAGGSVGMGVSVSVPDADDTVSVTITGLASYETITDGANSTIFSGSSVTLTAAEVNSGLTLHSTFGGTGNPQNTLTLVASNTTGGEAISSTAQKITVTDPPAGMSPCSLNLWRRSQMPGRHHRHAIPRSRARPVQACSWRGRSIEDSGGRAADARG